MKYTDYDIDIMGRTMIGEADSEGDRGMEAVACVIRNRALHSGKSLAFECKRRWQFSCWNENDSNRKRIENLPYNDPRLAHAREIARRVVESYSDITIGATHYLNKEVTRQIRPNGDLPSWVDESRHTITIGRHDFYDLHGEFEKGKLLQLLSRLSLILKRLKKYVT